MSSQIHAKITGPIVMIGFGSIGKGTLPLIERHFEYDKSRFVIIDPHDDGALEVAFRTARTEAKAAFGNLAKATTETQEGGNTLVFDLQSYTFDDFAAHVTMTISVKNPQGEVFKKTYTAHGNSQGGKMFFGGVFGMKNAVQQSTKFATDEIIASFIRDLKASGKLAAATQG